MKLTKDYLKKVINEELKRVIMEETDDVGPSTLGGRRGTTGGAGVINVDPSTVGRGAVSLGPKQKKGNLAPIIITKFFPDPSKITNRDKMLEGLGYRKGVITNQYRDCGPELLQVKQGCRGLGVLKLQSFLKTAQSALAAKGIRITDPAVDGVFGPETQKAYFEVMDRMKDVSIPAARGSKQMMQCTRSSDAGRCTKAYFIYLDEELKGKDTNFNSKEYAMELDARLKAIEPDLKLLVNPGCVATSSGRVKCDKNSRFINVDDYSDFNF